ncbi:MAG: 4Fe-4S dicluster domain-containing protein [Burkholderiaceae bacterium]
MTNESTTAPDAPLPGGHPGRSHYHRVSIDAARCDGCMICVVVCPSDILELVGPVGDRKARVKEDWAGCMSCNNCYAVCASQAIRATQPYALPAPREQMRIGEFAPPRNF